MKCRSCNRPLSPVSKYRRNRKVTGLCRSCWLASVKASGRRCFRRGRTCEVCGITINDYATTARCPQHPIERSGTTEEALRAIREWSERHAGFAPTEREWLRDHPKGIPTTNTLIKRLGSWNATIQAAGLTTNKSGVQQERMTAMGAWNHGGDNVRRPNRTMVTGGR